MPYLSKMLEKMPAEGTGRDVFPYIPFSCFVLSSLLQLLLSLVFMRSAFLAAPSLLSSSFPPLPPPFTLFFPLFILPPSFTFHLPFLLLLFPILHFLLFPLPSVFPNPFYLCLPSPYSSFHLHPPSPFIFLSVSPLTPPFHLPSLTPRLSPTLIFPLLPLSLPLLGPILSPPPPPICHETFNRPLRHLSSTSISPPSLHPRLS